MKVIIAKDSNKVGMKVAAEIINLLKVKKEAVLGLATGGTAEAVYPHLIKSYNKKEIDFKKVKTINLDEYKGLDGKNEQSYRYFMDKNLFEHVNIEKKNTFVPKGIGDKEKNLKEFNDKKIEHAEFGIKALFEDELITTFIDDRKYDNIIYKAIYNHNKFKIENDMNSKELLHCKIIRDADKLDNFRVKQKDKLEDMFPKIYNNETINYENISSKVYADFMKHKCIKVEDRKTIIDYWVCVIAFIFDLNFDISLQYIKEKNYIDILIDRIEYKNYDTKQKMEDIRKCTKEYIENKCN